MAAIAVTRSIEDTRTDLAALNAQASWAESQSAILRLISDVARLVDDSERLYQADLRERVALAPGRLVDVIARALCDQEESAKQGSAWWGQGTDFVAELVATAVLAAGLAAPVGETPDEPRDLTFTKLRQKSQSRRDRWHTPETEPWTCADWSNAMCGEAGEAANVVKKIRRHETGMPDKIGRDRLVEMLGLELADVVAYADLLAAHFGMDLGACVAAKFNLVSEREGFPERLPVPALPVEEQKR